MPEITPTDQVFLEDGENRVYWERFGASDRVVCLLNGLAMHTKAWYGFLDEFLPDYGVLLYDYLGLDDRLDEYSRAPRFSLQIFQGTLALSDVTSQGSKVFTNARTAPVSRSGR